MIRVFFDHQYKFLGNNIRTFYEILISELKKDNEFTIIESDDIKISKKILREEQYDIFHPTGVDNYFLKMISDKKKMAKHEKFYKEYFLRGGEPFYAGVHGPEFLEKARKKQNKKQLRMLYLKQI